MEAVTAQNNQPIIPPILLSAERDRDRKYFYSPLPDGIVQKHVNIDTLELYLNGHPDQQTVKYVLTGLRAGFDLGFNRIRNT